jgi:hypothetical protein
LSNFPTRSCETPDYCWNPAAAEALITLAGDAIKLILKAILSGPFKADTLPDRSLLRDVFTRDFTRLVKLCHLEDERRSRSDGCPEFVGYWSIITARSEASRYGEVRTDEAGNLMKAIEGILPWLRSKL